MDIRRLEAFCKVFELGSFSKAGQDLFLSQPTISAHVSSLEEELGVQLFDRLGRMILPTQAGDVLYRHARDIFTSMEAAKADIQLLRDKVTGELVVGASSIPSTYLLPMYLAEFSRRYPDVRLQLRGGDSSKIIDMVSSGELLIGVVGTSQDNAELGFTPLCDDELVAIAAPGFRHEHAALFLEQEPTTWPWIMRERGSGTRKTFEGALGEAGYDPRNLRIALGVENTETALMCVKSGFGVTVTSRLAASQALAAREVEVIPMPGISMKRRFFLVRHEKRSMFPVIRYFTEFLLNACDASDAKSAGSGSAERSRTDAGAA